MQLLEHPKINGNCVYKGKCNTAMVIYKVLCKCYGKFYIGKIQNLLKSRVSDHITDVGKLWRAKQIFNSKSSIGAVPLSPANQSLATILEDSSSAQTVETARSRRLARRNHQKTISTPEYH